jgi:hypothetical protein
VASLTLQDVAIKQVKTSVGLRPYKPLQIRTAAAIEYGCPEVSIYTLLGRNRFAGVSGVAGPSLTGQIKADPLIGLFIEPVKISSRNVAVKMFWRLVDQTAEGVLPRLRAQLLPSYPNSHSVLLQCGRFDAFLCSVRRRRWVACVGLSRQLVFALAPFNESPEGRRAWK